MPSTTNRTLIAQYQALITGIPLRCPNATFTIAGITYTASQAVQMSQSVLTSLQAVPAALAVLSTARQASAKSLSTDGAIVEEIRTCMLQMFSNMPTPLHDLGLTPRKARTPLSAAARLAATLKSNATRAARGTTSKKEKAAISGNVTGVTITPVTTAAAPGATPSVNPTTAAPAMPVATPVPAPAIAGSGAARS